MNILSVLTSLRWPLHFRLVFIRPLVLCSDFHGVVHTLCHFSGEHFVNHGSVKPCFASHGRTIYRVCRPRPSDLLSDGFDSFGQSGVGVVRLVPAPGAEDILCADQGPGNRGLHEGTKAAKRCSAPSLRLQQVLSSINHPGVVYCTVTCVLDIILPLLGIWVVRTYRP